MDNCPKCGANWIGGDIPEEIRHHYSPPYVWKREIGIDGGHLGIYDGCIAYKCVDCGEYSPVSNGAFHLDVFNKFINILKGDFNEKK